MTETPHFYTVGGTLPPTARSYVTRRADEMLLTHLLRGDFCYVLTSRQMGKSSLMVRTAGALRENGVAVAILDLTRLGQNLTPEQWYDGLLVRLGVELKLEDALDDYWVQDRVSRLGPMQRFIGALREVVLPSRTGNIVIFIDEIDSVRSLPFSSDEFFAGIRELYNGRVSDPELERISFCLLGVAQPSDLISNVNITPFNIGHRIELTDFTEAEAQPLLQGLQGLQGAAGRQTDNVVILQRILYWTGGHPYLTQRLFETVAGSLKTVSRADVDRACEELFLSSRSREKEDNLLFVRDRVLAEKEDRSSILDLYGKVLRGKKIKDDDANPTIDVLRLSGIVSVSKGYLTVRNRIYATVFNRNWVIANMPDAELRRQKAAYRRGLAFATGIGLVVLTIVVVLGAFAYRSGESELREHYFADAAAAQQAFESGDMKTGDAILGEWKPLKPDEWWQLPQYWWREYAYDRPHLVNRFSFHLLEAEEKGNDSHFFQEGSAVDKFTGCGEFRAVAAATHNKRQIIAAGGADSIVYLWHAADIKHPFAALKLNNPGLPNHPFPTNPPPCDKLKQAGGPGIMSLSFSPNGRRLAISTGSWGNQDEDGRVLLWDMDDRSQVKDLHAKFSQAADSTLFSSDGKFLAASGDDNTAKIWQLSGLEVVGEPTVFDPRVQGEAGKGKASVLLKEVQAVGKMSDAGRLVGNGANAVALSSPGRHLIALGYGDGHLVIYDDRRPTAPLFNQIVHVSGIMSLLFVDDKCLAVGTRDGELLLFDPDLLSAARNDIAAEPLHSLDTEQGILQSLATSPDRKWLATGGSNGTIVLWSRPNLDLRNGPKLDLRSQSELERTEVLRGHQGRVYSIAFAFCQSAAANCLVSGSQDKDVRLWKVPTAIPHGRYQETKYADPQDEDVTPTRLLVHGQAIGLAFPDKNTVIAGVGTTTAEDGKHSGNIVFWDPPKKSAPAIPVDDGAPIVSFAVSPDGEFVATSSRNRNLVLVGVKDKKQDPPVPAHITLSSIHVTCSSQKAGDVRTCPDHTYRIAGIADPGDHGTDGETVSQGLCLWSVFDNGLGKSPRFTVTQDKVAPCFQRGRFSHRGRRDNRTSSPDFKTLVSKVTAVAFSTDGKTVATSFIKDDGTHVYVGETADLMAGKLSAEGKQSQKSFPEQFYQLAFSPEGNYLAGTTITSSFYYWRTDQTNKVPTPDQKYQLKSAETISDENQENSASDLSSRGMTLAFSPKSDQHVLAIGLEDSRILLWSTEDHRVTMQIHRHTGGVQALAFSPDGSELASAGNDGRVILLQDCKTGPTPKNDHRTAKDHRTAPCDAQGD